MSTAINALRFFKVEDGQAITVTTHQYIHMTETFHIPRVQNLPRHENLLVQQDGATAHMEKINMTVIYSLFLKQAIPISLMVLASLLTISNCSHLHFWGYLEGKVYGCWPADIDELKAGIQEEIMNISEEALRQNFQTHAHQSIKKIAVI